MVSPGHIQSYLKQDSEDNLDLKSDRDKDKEEHRDDDKKKQISSKLRKYGKEEEADDTDSNGRKISAWDRDESRKRSGSDDDDYEVRKKSRLKQIKKKQEESSLEKLSNWYQDRESESRHDGSRRQIEANRERSPVLKLEMIEESDSGYLERRESSREKGHGTFELGRNQRRKWDEADAARQAEENSYVEKSDLSSAQSSDHRRGNANISVKIEPDDNKTKGLDINNDRSIKSYDTELLKSDSDHCHRNTIGLDVVENHERTFNADENDNTWMRGRTRRDSDHLNRSRTPERTQRAHNESENFEIENERSNTSRWREVEKDGYRNDRPKRRDDSLSDKTREQEGSKDTWKRGQVNITDKERKNEDTIYDCGREWELQRRGREKYDGERCQGHFGVRKDGNRTEAVKTSWKCGISSENYDVIEIQTNPFCYGKDEPRPSSPRRAGGTQQSDMKLASDHEFTYPLENKTRKIDPYASGQSGYDVKDGIIDDGSSMYDQNSLRDEIGSRVQKGFVSNFPAVGQIYSGGSQPPHRNEESGSFGRSVPQGVKGNRGGRGGRARLSGRDNQQVAITVPMLGSPVGPPGMPPRGGMQPLTPNMSPAQGPLVSPGFFIPPFLPPVVWPGAQGFEMNSLAVPPGLSPISSGLLGPRFSPNIGTTPSPAMYFDQVGLCRGSLPNVSGPTINSMIPAGRGQPQDKVSGGWVTPKSNGPQGRGPSRGEQNDYSQNFVDTGMRPQNFIRELELTSVVEDYPKLRDLIQRKDEIVAKSASPPMYYKCDLHEQELSPDLFGTKFDVILVDPPWEEYVHRGPGVTDHMQYWTFEEIMNLKIEAIADTPSFIFLWVGNGAGLEQGRQCLKKWGFRRCEDICWVKTNKPNATPGLRHDSHTLFQRSKEHCLMGIKGTVRRSIDGHIIHANIDTDVIIAEESHYGSTAKPEDMYRIVEHFALGRRRLELFGEDHNIRSGWLTVGKELSSSNFNMEAYVISFADKDGKVWQGGGRNPPPEAPHLVKTTPEIEALRPKSPMRGQQQQQSTSISLTTASSSNRRPIGNSPQNHTAPGLNQEVSSSNPLSHWASPMESFKGIEGSNIDSEERILDMPGYDLNFGQANEDYLDFETQKAMHIM